MLGAVPDVIHTAEFESALGLIRVASSDQGLAYVGLPHANGRGFMGWLQRYGGSAVTRSNRKANLEFIEQLLEFVEGRREDFEIPLDLRATEFQHRVYEATARIPFGEICSYADIAKAAGVPKATRAVGAALGSNPIPLVIPCHRVIGSRGKLQGYAGGLAIKARLLASERSGSMEGRLF